MNKKNLSLIVLAIIITGIVLVMIVSYTNSKRSVSKTVKKNLTGDFKIENVQRAKYNNTDAYRVKVDYKNKFLGICGKMIKINDGIVYIQGQKMFLNIPESEVKRILKGKGDIEKIKFGNFKVGGLDKKCQLDNTYKVLLKLSQKEGKFTHKEIYINRFGNILYSRPAFFSALLGGKKAWGYGPGKFGQL